MQTLKLLEENTGKHVKIQVLSDKGSTVKNQPEWRHMKLRDCAQLKLSPEYREFEKKIQNLKKKILFPLHISQAINIQSTQRTAEFKH